MNDIWVIAQGDSEIGLAAALRFARAGARPVLCLTQALSAAAKEALKGCPYEIASVDWQDEQSVRAAAREADGLFYNRRPPVVKESLLTMPLECVDQLIDRDMIGAFLAVKCFGEAMGKKKRGSVALLGSIHDDKPIGASATLSLYAGALRNMCFEAALYYGEKNVRCNLIEAGPLAGEGERLTGGASRFYDGYRYKIPSGAAGTAEDMANLACFLLSDQSAYINGAPLRMDGGLVHEYIDALTNARAIRRMTEAKNER